VREFLLTHKQKAEEKKCHIFGQEIRYAGLLIAVTAGERKPLIAYIVLLWLSSMWASTDKKQNERRNKNKTKKIRKENKPLMVMAVNKQKALIWLEADQS